MSSNALRIFSPYLKSPAPAPCPLYFIAPLIILASEQSPQLYVLLSCVEVLILWIRYGTPNPTRLRLPFPQ